MLEPLRFEGSVANSPQKMEALHGEGVRLILYLQNAFSGFTREMLFLSHVGDPKNSFLIYFPLSYHLDRAVGLMVLWVAVLSEWLNLILKWFLRGERPYWWISETEGWKDVELSQYPLTCETGPGSPSGHAMVTTSVLFTMIPLLAQQIHCLLRTAGPLQRRVIHLSLWFAFLTVITLVSLSRIFIATHFPHQVIGGVFGGIVISCIAQKTLDLSKFMSVTKCGIVSFMLMISTLSVYEILSLAIFNPSESVQKALKWCANPDYIHIETRPFYALVRDTGAVFGIGLAHWLANSCCSNIPDKAQKVPYNDSSCSKNPSFVFSVMEIILSITLIQLMESLKLSFDDEIVSYVFGYFKNMILVAIVVFITPFIITLVQGRDSKTKKN